MQIKFNRDFRGRETGEVFYAQGEVADVSDAFALVLVADGVAERAKEVPAPKAIEPEPSVEPEPSPLNPNPSSLIPESKKGKR